MFSELFVFRRGACSHNCKMRSPRFEQDLAFSWLLLWYLKLTNGSFQQARVRFVPKIQVCKDILAQPATLVNARSS